MKRTAKVEKFKSLANRLSSLMGSLQDELYLELKQNKEGTVEYRELAYLLNEVENGGNPLHILDDIEKFHRERVEGVLVTNSSGRYELGNHEFTCASYIEIFIDDPGNEDYGWQFGRVEHDDRMGGYYFYRWTGWEHHRLREGMLAAYRKS